MLDSKEHLIVLIPAYEPEEKFVAYAKTVSAFAYRLVVVNDGSDASFDPIFDEIASLENVCYLKHEQNLGKGCALKTALRFCTESFSPEAVIVTADCDGQHASEDVLKVFGAVCEHPEALILGSRDFTLENIPPNSRFGNAFFRHAYRLFYRIKIYDTQTGLRGFTVGIAKELLLVRGKRFEYEMSVLVYTKKNVMPVIEVPIQTIYPENPQDHKTHYRPAKDGMRILSVVVKNMGARRRKRAAAIRRAERLHEKRMSQKA